METQDPFRHELNSFGAPDRWLQICKQMHLPTLSLVSHLHGLVLSLSDSFAWEVRFPTTNVVCCLQKKKKKSEAYCELSIMVCSKSIVEEWHWAHCRKLKNREIRMKERRKQGEKDFLVWVVYLVWGCMHIISFSICARLYVDLTFDQCNFSYID